MAADKSIKIALVTMNSTPDFPRNMSAAQQQIADAKAQQTDWVILPEMFPVLGDADAIKNTARLYAQDIYQKLTSWAKEYQITIFAGSVPEYIDGEGKCYNTTYVISPDGKEIAKYRKIHLFELNDLNGNKILSEKDNYLAGEQPTVLKINDWNIGLAICYDLRFPAFFEKLAETEDLDAIVIPAAFTYATGKDHWQILLRARAIEQQCFVLAANQCGTHSGSLRSYGHSMAIDPWGRVLVNSEGNIGNIYSSISKDSIQEAKARVPSRLNKIF